MEKFVKLSLLLLSLLIALTGCSKKEKNSIDQASNEPVTLKVFQSGAVLSDEEFQRYFFEPVKKKYPNITLELVRNEQGKTPEELLTSGEFPDIVFSGNIVSFKRLGVTQDLNPLVKQNRLNLDIFDPAIIEGIKQRGNNGELLAIPVFQNVGVLVYNKDLFNKFGVPYPTDALDWDQVSALARKLTKTVDGVQYVGYDQPTIHLFGSGLSLPYIDANTNKAAIVNDGWKRAFQTAKSFFEIPGYIGPNNKFKYGNDGFFKTRNLAMLTQWLNQVLVNVAPPNAEGLDWDLAPYPNYKEALGTGREGGPLYLMISNTSKYQDQAFRVISVVTGEEVQSSMSRKGRLSVLKNSDIQKNYAADLPEFKGKNIEAIFKTKPAKTHNPLTEYDDVVTNAINTSAQELATGSKDINTLLREAEEKANANLESLKAK